MTDPIPRAEEATRYVLGQLDPAESREFQARLSQSAELRALVRELEDGAVALTMAVPRREAPPHILRQIEEAVSAEVEEKLMRPSVWGLWLRNGWAATAACLLGWGIYALWSTSLGHLSGGSLHGSLESLRSGSASQNLGSTNPEADQESRPATIITNIIRPFPRVNPAARAGEIASLQQQVAELGNQLSNLSQVLTQQQGLFTAPGRLKFFQLAPPNAGSNGGWVAAPPSPELQRALMLAAARELGWINIPATRQPGGDAHAPEANAQKTTTSQNLGVDFVDLPPLGRSQTERPLMQYGSNQPAVEPQLQAQTDPEIAPPVSVPPAEVTISSAAATLAGTNPVIPGFFSGTNMVLALNTHSMSTSEGAVTFWTGTSGAGYTSLGSVILGSNPMVVTIPYEYRFSTGPNLWVTSGTGFWSATSSVLLGVFPASGTNGP